jgi:hypothetical protein
VRYGNISYRQIGRDCFVFVICFISSIRLSMAIAPTESEWRTWPEYCKAAFLYSQWSDETPAYHKEMSMNRVAQIVSTLGIPGAHHFCMGLVDINRARTMSLQSSARRATLERAVSGIYYSLKDMAPAASRYSLVSAYYGTALYLSGKRALATEAWNKGIEAHPASRESYLAMAEALLGEK